MLNISTPPPGRETRHSVTSSPSSTAVQFLFFGFFSFFLGGGGSQEKKYNLHSFVQLFYSHGPQYPPWYLGSALGSMAGYRQGTAVWLYWANSASMFITTCCMVPDTSLCSFGSSVMLNSQMFFSAELPSFDREADFIMWGGGTQLPLPEILWHFNFHNVVICLKFLKQYFIIC